MRFADPINEAELLRVACDLLKQSDQYALSSPTYAAQLTQQAYELGRRSKRIKRQILHDKMGQLRRFQRVASPLQIDPNLGQSDPYVGTQRDLGLRRILERQKHMLLKSRHSGAARQDINRSCRLPRRMMVRAGLVIIVLAASLLA